MNEWLEQIHAFSVGEEEHPGLIHGMGKVHGGFDSKKWDLKHLTSKTRVCSWNWVFLHAGLNSPLKMSVPRKSHRFYVHFLLEGLLILAALAMSVGLQGLIFGVVPSELCKWHLSGYLKWHDFLLGLPHCNPRNQ